jgi:hypothetical protein
VTCAAASAGTLLTVSKAGSTTSVAVFFGLVEGNGATGGGDIFFEGGLEPGPEFAAGDVVFDNNVAFGSQAMLEIELGDDAQYDHIDVTGLLTLDGTLDVELVPGYRPNLGDSFDILDWGTRSGEFDTLDLPGLLGNLKWDTSRLYSDGVLAVLAVGLPGDYNQNGVVDAADYALWRKNPGNFPADAYATWRSHFGQTAGGSGASLNTTVPEPATLVMLMFAAAGWCLPRDRAA